MSRNLLFLQIAFAFCVIQSVTSKTVYCLDESLEERNWSYCAKMAFAAGATAEISYMYTSSADTSKTLSMFILTDREWTSVHELYQDQVLCEGIEKIAKHKVMISPEEDNSLEVTIGERPEIWFFVLADCQDHFTPLVQIRNNYVKMEIFNNGSHFSYEESNMITIFALFFIVIFTLLMMSIVDIVPEFVQRPDLDMLLRP